ncbi:hypothetical protein HY483_03435 [Candidatus Woesearchaeota archaeon]|nr:hypothetical protein [Candidatus Woesearchaeota archaeon]
MKAVDIVNAVESSEVFQLWALEHKGFFLSHIFVMLESSDEFQLGYYFDDRMHSFLLERGVVTSLSHDEILKTEHEIIPLDVNEVVLDMDDAVNIAREQLVLQYPREAPIKTFFIVQTLQIGTVFNFTYFCQSFKTVNFKISTIDGKILHHSCDPLIGQMK